MSTSRTLSLEPKPTGWRRTLAQSSIAFSFVLAVHLIAERAGVIMQPHPGWNAVLLLGARAGRSGFFAGLIGFAFAASIGSAISGVALATTWARLDTAPNQVAFGACLAVSWIASWHLRRHANISAQRRLLTDRLATAETTIGSLRGVVAALRARVDHTSASLSFLRDVAARLEGKDPIAAAEGAADLALARTGACAAQVRAGRGDFQRLLAVRDARGPRAVTPLALRDASLMVPIVNGTDRVGAIALWGIPRSRLEDSTANDLAVIASWCARSLTAAASGSAASGSAASGSAASSPAVANGHKWSLQ